MALKDIWKNKVNGVDDVDAEDINEIAQAVIKIEKNGVGNGGNTDIVIDNEMSDTSENAVQNKVIKNYVDNSIGNIEDSLDAIIEIQNSLIGGDSK
jgi:tetrahydromethanopterin S-methyltransferase subunit A